MKSAPVGSSVPLLIVRRTPVVPNVRLCPGVMLTAPKANLQVIAVQPEAGPATLVPNVVTVLLVLTLSGPVMPDTPTLLRVPPLIVTPAATAAPIPVLPLLSVMPLRSSVPPLLIVVPDEAAAPNALLLLAMTVPLLIVCLLYTSDAADE